MSQSPESYLDRAKTILTTAVVALTGGNPPMPPVILSNNGEGSDGHFHPRMDTPRDTGRDLPDSASRPAQYRRGVRARVARATEVGNSDNGGHVATPKIQLQELLHDLYAGEIAVDRVIRFLYKYPSFVDSPAVRKAAYNFGTLRAFRLRYLANVKRDSRPNTKDFSGDGFDHEDWASYGVAEEEDDTTDRMDDIYDESKFDRPFPPELTLDDFPASESLEKFGQQIAKISADLNWIMRGPFPTAFNILRERKESDGISLKEAHRIVMDVRTLLSTHLIYIGGFSTGLKSHENLKTLMRDLMADTKAFVDYDVHEPSVDDDVEKVYVPTASCANRDFRRGRKFHKGKKGRLEDAIDL